MWNKSFFTHFFIHKNFVVFTLAPWKRNKNTWLEWVYNSFKWHCDCFTRPWNFSWEGPWYPTICYTYSYYVQGKPCVTWWSNRAIWIRSEMISDNLCILLGKCDTIETIIMLFSLVSFCFAVGINVLIWCRWI